MTPPAEPFVYKILTAADWQEAVARGSYEGSSDDKRDGFIHLSMAEQLAGTASRHFRNKAGLLLVAFDATSLGPALRWEVSRGGALFPHLYQPLDPSLSLKIWAMPLGPDGIPHVPGKLLP